MRVLDDIVGSSSREQLVCIIETNRGLLITALLEAAFAVYPVNPKTVDRRRVASGAKTDRIDVYLLAKLGRSELANLRRLAPDSPTIQHLKALTRDQDALIQIQTGLVLILERFGPWTTVASRYQRWCKEGLWARILHVLLPVEDSFASSA